MHQNIRFGRMPSLLPGKRRRIRYDLPVLGGAPLVDARGNFSNLTETEFCSFPARLLMFGHI